MERTPKVVEGAKAEALEAKRASTAAAESFIFTSIID